MNAIVSRGIQGEVLDGKHVVRVFGAPHPLMARCIDREFMPGLTIAEILDQSLADYPSRLRETVVVYLNGDKISREVWHRVRPKPGTQIAFQAVPAGGMRTMLLAAVAVFALVASGGLLGPAGLGLLGSSFAAGGLGASALALGITVGGTMLINALFPLQPVESDQKERYSITGANNQTTPYQPVPVVLGRHRVYPVQAARPYTEIIGEDQYLSMFLMWGYGPLDISSVKIGETPLSSFEGVTVEHDYGDGDPSTALFPNSVIEDQLSIVLEQDENNDRTTASDIDEISVDISFPNGLYSQSDEGPKQAKSEFSIYYRPTGVGSYQLAQSVSVEKKSQSPLRFSYKITPTARGQFDVRVVRTDNPRDNGSDRTVWTALRGLRKQAPVAFSKPIATTVLRIKATNQLSGVIDSLNGVITSMCVRSSGGSWGTTRQQTNNPADLVRWVLQGPMNARPVANSKIDLTTLAAWGRYCEVRGYKYNAVVTSPRSVWEQVAEICSAGRAVPIFRDGQWSVVWDDSDDDPGIVQHFTTRNSSGFSSSRQYKRTPHGWRVRFVNERNEWQDDERLVYDDGYTKANATEFEAIEFPGVTDPDLIWKHGRFHIAQARLRPEIYELTVDWENLICQRGDRVRVTHDIPLWGQAAGRVKSVDGTTVVVDELCTMVAGPSYGIRFRMADGTTVTRNVTSNPGEQTSLALTSTLAGSGVAAGDLFMFGERDSESVVLRVLAVEPGENMTARLSLVDDAPGINQADKGSIPAFDSQVSAPIDPSRLAPHDVQAMEYLYSSGSNVLSAVTVSWQVERTGEATAYQVQRTTPDSATDWITAATVPVPQTSYDILGLAPGTYSFRVRALFANGTASAWATASNAQVSGVFGAPADITNFSINVLRDTATLTWDPVRTLNFSHYELRHSPEMTGVTWGTANILFPRLAMNVVQAPSMSGTFLVKAVTLQGVASANPAVITSDISGIETLNVIATIDEDPTFGGVKDGTEVVSGELRLGSATFMDDWTTLASVAQLYGGTTDLTEGGDYYWSNAFDLGVAGVMRLTPRLVAHGETQDNMMAAWGSLSAIEALDGADPSQWSVRHQYRKTFDNPAGSPVWSDWSDIILSDVNARALQFRTRLETLSDLAVVPVVEELGMSIDMDDRVESGSGTSLSGSTLTVTFSPAFKDTPHVGVTGLNMATGDYYVVSSISATGFVVRFFNSSNAGVARNFNWLAKGYGRVT
jgi:hypothetical protein